MADLSIYRGLLQPPEQAYSPDELLKLQAGKANLASIGQQQQLNAQEMQINEGTLRDHSMKAQEYERQRAEHAQVQGIFEKLGPTRAALPEVYKINAKAGDALSVALDKAEAAQTKSVLEKGKLLSDAAARLRGIKDPVQRLASQKVEVAALAASKQFTPEQLAQMNSEEAATDEQLGSLINWDTQNKMATAAQVADKNKREEAEAARKAEEFNIKKPTITPNAAGLTPKDAATVAGQEATRAAQAKRDANTERHQTAMEGIARHKLAKGGDSNISETADAVIDSPALFDRLTPTERGKLVPELRRRGYKEFGKTPSEASIKHISEMKSALGGLADLKQVLKENEQYIGPLAGLQAHLPYSDARKAQAKIDLIKQRVGKTLEGGVLRKEDEEKYKKILAQLTDEPSTAFSKLDGVVTEIERDLATFVDEQRRGGRNMSGQDKDKPAAGTGGASLPKGGGKALDKATAARFYEAAGNDPAKARKMATDAGWKLE